MFDKKDTDEPNKGMNRLLGIGILFLSHLMLQAEEPLYLKMNHACALGFTQGVTEFLPVSSTGHMILVNEFFQGKASGTDEAKEVLKETRAKVIEDYMMIIQLGTTLVLFLFYRKEIRRILRGLIGEDPVGLRLGLKVALAFIPVGLCGFLFNDWIQEKLYNRTCVLAAIFIGGFFIFWLERYRKQQTTRWNVEQMPWRTALGIGLFQMIALWPGFSRSLATIAGGIVCGLSLLQAVRFSFLLDLLTSLVAITYKSLKHGTEILYYLDGTCVTMGIVVAFFVGLFTINLFINYLARHGLKIFGYYRLILALVFYFSQNGWTIS